MSIEVFDPKIRLVVLLSPRVRHCSILRVSPNLNLERRLRIQDEDFDKHDPEVSHKKNCRLKQQEKMRRLLFRALLEATSPFAKVFCLLVKFHRKKSAQSPSGSVP
jgi:hypothetical protein